MRAASISAGKSADKWKIFRDISEARVILGLPDRALTVLDALISFYPENELSEEKDLVVFPSNAQLAVRAHGMAEATLRRHLASLVDAGLIHRRDSPNGKRYVHRGKGGEVEKAFGFSLAPLLAQVEDLAHLAQQVVEERRLLKRAKETLTICRRDVRKLITAAVEEGAEGDWEAIEGMYIALVARAQRTPTKVDVDTVLDEMSLLRDEILNTLEIQEETQNMSGNAAQNERHIQNSKPESIHELEPCSEKEQGEPTEEKSQRKAEPRRPFPLSLVLKACPEIVMYGPAGAIRDWRGMMSAAVVVRSTLGVSPSAYQDACEVLGPENAATAIACILERAGHINSPGGYLRDLTRKAAREEFGLGPMLMALMRANPGREQKSA